MQVILEGCHPADDHPLNHVDRGQIGAAEFEEFIAFGHFLCGKVNHRQKQRDRKRIVNEVEERLPVEQIFIERVEYAPVDSVALNLC